MTKKKDKELKSKKAALPADVIKFAKQMGIDLDGLEPEAQEIWTKLNDMSMKDPVQYEKFVADQMQLAKDEGMLDKDKVTPKAPSSSSAAANETKTFRPEAGFIYTAETTGGDGAKVRMMAETKKLFVNVCSSKVLEPPRDDHRQPVAASFIPLTSSLEVPLLVGPVRSIDEDNCNVIDVVVHPSIIEACCNSKIFKEQMLELSSHWIEEDSSLQIQAGSWKEYLSDEVEPIKYYEGLGDDKSIPTLFHITKDMMDRHENKGKTPAKTAEKPLASTQSLLSEMRKGQEDTSLTDTNIKIAPAITEYSTKKIDNSTTENDGKSKEKKKVRICEINEKGEAIEPTDVLDNTPPQTTTTATTNQTNNTSDSKGFQVDPNKFKKAIATNDKQPNKTFKAPSKIEYEKLEKLMEQCDDEYAAGRGIGSEFDGEDMLRQLAGAFHPPPGVGGDIKPPTPKTIEPITISQIQSNINHKSNDVSTTVTPPSPPASISIIKPPHCPIGVQAQSKSKDEIQVTLTNLNYQQESNPLGIEASSTLIRMKYNNNADTIQVQRPAGASFQFDTKNISAKFNKKQNSAIVTIKLKV